MSGQCFRNQTGGDWNQYSHYSLIRLKKKWGIDKKKNLLKVINQIWWKKSQDQLELGLKLLDQNWFFILYVIVVTGSTKPSFPPVCHSVKWSTWRSRQWKRTVWMCSYGYGMRGLTLPHIPRWRWEFRYSSVITGIQVEYIFTWKPELKNYIAPDAILAITGFTWSCDEHLKQICSQKILGVNKLKGRLVLPIKISGVSKETAENCQQIWLLKGDWFSY